MSDTVVSFLLRRIRESEESVEKTYSLPNSATEVTTSASTRGQMVPVQVTGEPTVEFSLLGQ